MLVILGSGIARNTEKTLFLSHLCQSYSAVVRTKQQSISVNYCYTPNLLVGWTKSNIQESIRLCERQKEREIEWQWASAVINRHLAYCWNTFHQEKEKEIFTTKTQSELYTLLNNNLKKLIKGNLFFISSCCEILVAFTLKFRYYQIIQTGVRRELYQSNLWKSDHEYGYRCNR